MPASTRKATSYTGSAPHVLTMAKSGAGKEPAGIGCLAARKRLFLRRLNQRRRDVANQRRRDVANQRRRDVANQRRRDVVK